MKDTGAIRFSVTKSKSGKYMARSRFLREPIEENTREDLLEAIREFYDVNKHHKRKGIWIFPEPKTLKKVDKFEDSKKSKKN